MTTLAGASSRKKCRSGLYDFRYGSSYEGPAAAATRRLGRLRQVVPGVSIGDVVSKKGSTRFNFMKICICLVFTFQSKIVPGLTNSRKMNRKSKIREYVIPKSFDF